MHTPTVMFESWRGRYADNPRAISQELSILRPELRQIWVAEETTELPPGVERVRRHSPEYFARLLSCDFLITNDIVSKHLVKGPRVTYLQTWHGTPLKTMGFDEHMAQYPGAAAHMKRMVRDVKKWDYLLSASPECSGLLRSAFHYGGPILETGYPRNDILNSPQAGAIRRTVRSRLGLESGQQVVLYAPTWRDNSVGAGGIVDPGALDVGLLRQLLPAGTVLLNRLHSVVQARQGSDDGFLRDVSNYPDIAELYLAADVLVSDYSSAVYDFAVTGKPIVLFAYDLAGYRDDVRGMYFDYDQWAPGPVVADTEALADVLTDAAAHQLRLRDRYDGFVQRFCPNEDGKASRRVIEAVF